MGHRGNENVLFVERGLPFGNDLQNRTKNHKLSFKLFLDFGLESGGVFGLVDIEELLAGADVLNGEGDSFFVIVAAEVGESVGFEAGGGHDFGNVDLVHPFDPFGCGIAADFKSDVVDEAGHGIKIGDGGGNNSGGLVF